MTRKRSKKNKQKQILYTKSILHAFIAKWGSKDNESLDLWSLEHTWCEQMLILRLVGMFLIISPFDDIWTIKNVFPHDLHMYLIICMKKSYNPYF